MFYRSFLERKECCGDHSIDGALGFRMGSGLLGQWPIRDRIPVRGYPGPRHNSSEDDRFRGRSRRGLITIRAPNSVISKGRAAD